MPTKPNSSCDGDYYLRQPARVDVSTQLLLAGVSWYSYVIASEARMNLYDPARRSTEYTGRRSTESASVGIR
jgi:hypothetical protein